MISIVISSLEHIRKNVKGSNITLTPLVNVYQHKPQLLTFQNKGKISSNFTIFKGLKMVSERSTALYYSKDLCHKDS